MFAVSRLASGRVRTKQTWISVGFAAVPIVLVACGSGRNYDNPPAISAISVDSSSSSSQPATTTITTLFVPSTAPTTLAPPTVRPTSPPEPPPPPETPRPTEATVPTTPVATTGDTYSVQRGDTLFGISRRLGVTLDALLSANGMNQNSLITPGQALQIPVGGSVPATNATTPATSAPTPAINATTPATNATTPAPNPTTPAPNPTGGTSPQVQPTTTFATPPNAVLPTGASATCQGDDSAEANGTPIVFSPSNVLDHNPGTAWRCPAPATGETLTVTLGGPTLLTSVGMIGGYAKVDPLTGIDRFTQNQRARQVIWRFSDGSSVTQDLADSRDMQTIPVNVTTDFVTVEIISTYPASGPDPKNNVVVAEVQLLG